MKKLFFKNHRLASARPTFTAFSYGKLKRLFPLWIEQLQQRIKSTANKEPLTITGKGALHGSWHGTPLPLLPNIRMTTVKIGEFEPELGEFGIDRKVGGEITLYPGPNKKMNRHLDRQYSRAITAIGGEITKTQIPALPTASSSEAATPSFITEIIWSIVWRDIEWTKISAEARRKYIKRARTFWAIAFHLLCRSHAFRAALIGKVLGKKDRWFHRDIDLEKLYKINRSYAKIVGQFKQIIPVRRCWIPQVGGKWRPLGIAPIAWRVYTRGLNNFLEVFLANGWPSNQHAYTTGRGVHTAWKVVLEKVIGSDDIWEADFSAFFNSVKLESVAIHLEKYGVPKYVAAHLINLCASEVTNISPQEMLTYDESWKLAWPKYEYIHLYRKSWRSRGLVQGFSLAPVLSVLTLVSFDAMVKELAGLAVKILYYADDLLIYGKLPPEIMDAVKAALEKSGIGAEFAWAKCSWVKRDGVWLTNLKFVGLLYNPFTNLLAAQTRAGATLPLFIGKARVQLKDLHVKVHERISSLMSSSPAINPVGIYDETMCVINSVSKSLSFLGNSNVVYPNQDAINVTATSLAMKTLCSLWNNMLDEQRKTVAELTESGVSRLLYSSRSFFTLLKSKPLSPESNPWTCHILAIKIARILDVHDPVYGFYESRTWAQISHNGWDRYFASYSLGADDQLDLNRPPLNLPLLSDLYVPSFASLQNWKFNSIGKSVTAFLHPTALEHPVGIGTFTNPEPPLIPAEIIEKLAVSKWNRFSELSAAQQSALAIPKNASINVAVLDWRNTWETPLFNMLISRMFSDSWSGNSTKQDFKMSSDEDSLADCLNKFGNAPRVLGDSIGSSTPVSVFNSTSISTFITTKLITHWSHPRRLEINDLWEKSYEFIYRKLAHRRTGPTPRKLIRKCVMKDAFYKKGIKNNFAELTEERRTAILLYLKNDPLDLDVLRTKPWVSDPSLLEKLSKKQPSFTDQFRTLTAFPLSPYDNFPPVGYAHKRAAFKKLSLLSGKGLQWETIRNSVYPEFELEQVSGNISKRPSRTDWFTWAPYMSGKRRSRMRSNWKSGASKS